MRLTRSHKAERARGLTWAIAAMLAVLSATDLTAQQDPGQVQYAPRPGAQQATTPGLQYGGGIQLTQRITANDSKPKRPLPYEIEDMPDIQEEMEVIHRRSQLVITRAPISRVAIADPSIIDVVQYSPTEMSILGLGLGSTVLHLWFDGSPEPLIYLVEIVPDPTYEDRLEMDFGKLEKQLQILFPNSKVYLIPLRRRLVVKGQARDAEEAAHILQIVQSSVAAEYGLSGQSVGGGGNGNFGGNNIGNNNNNGNNNNSLIVNLLEVPGNQQIMLHVKVAEVSRGQLRRLGVDLEWMLNDGRQILTSTLAGAGGALTGIFENSEVDVMVNWLAGNRTAKVLAAPTLTVLSGHSASFLSGGEFPVPTIVGIGGAQGTSTSFRGFGTSLLVQPTVVDKDWIQLNITPEYSQISGGGGGGGGVPSLNTRRVSTTVRLREGQTIVLAGLYGSTMTTEVDRIPFLGELPLIGPALFNAKTADQGQNELLIVVTPELVRPMEPDEVPPLPGFEVTAPNDIELYAYAKTEGYPDQGIYQLSPYAWGPGYASEVGYRPFNPAPAGNPFDGGAMMGGGGYQVASPGYMMQPQPTGLMPGPPPAQQQMMAPGMQQAPGMMPGATPMQPIPDQNMGMMGGNGGLIQQVGYQQPAPQRGSFMSWLKRQPAPNPALRATNTTSPSLQNGNDGRLGRGGTFRPQPNRQQMGRPQQNYQPGPYPR
mgnify:FL=1